MIRRALVLLAVSAVLGVASIAIARHFTQFLPPHEYRPVAAVLSPELRQAVAADFARTKPSSTEGVIALALDETNARLHFGLNHKGSFTFSNQRREAHCVEYAQLLAAVFNSLSTRAVAVPMHSASARVFGVQLPLPAWRDHDWVLVSDGDKRYFVDPTLADLGLGWDIADAVVAPRAMK